MEHLPGVMIQVGMLSNTGADICEVFCNLVSRPGPGPAQLAPSSINCLTQGSLLTVCCIFSSDRAVESLSNSETEDLWE